MNPMQPMQQQYALQPQASAPPVSSVDATMDLKRIVDSMDRQGVKAMLQWTVAIILMGAIAVGGP